MSYLRSFGPWIAYGIASSVVDRKAAAVVGLLVAVHAVRDQRRRFEEVDDLSQATRLFFLALVAVCLVAPEAALLRFTPALSLATLGAAAGLSVLEGRPFTLTFARRTTPPELWDLPIFHEVNRTITLVWTASFLTTAAACALALALAPHEPAIWIAFQVLGFAVPVWFTSWHRGRVSARFAGPSPSAA
ncbi:MAG: hypothetical protein R2746_03540 [Acidimicrobiales bacterium]